MGLVFVLLIGEIDLSAGWTSGVAAAVMAVALTRHHVPWHLAILAAVLTPTGDVMTMAVFTAPMLVLYLLGIAVAWLVTRSRREA